MLVLHLPFWHNLRSLCRIQIRDGGVQTQAIAKADVDVPKNRSSGDLRLQEYDKHQSISGKLCRTYTNMEELPQAKILY